MQSTSLHVALILDGNGRWAARRGLPRHAGHRAGTDRVHDIVAAAPGLGITTLTLYAFSSDNWQRPAAEVRALFALCAEGLELAGRRCRAEGARLRAIGRRDRLPLALRSAIAMAERRTRDGRRLDLRVALDYSGRDEILRAAREAGAAEDRTRFAAALGRTGRDGPPAPDVDLLVRTGGERRLSDFLLWEAAYAELWFTATCWPDFTPAHLARAVQAFHRRDRRFGRVRVPEGA